MTQGGGWLASSGLDEPIVCPTLIGRDRQFQALCELAAEAARGHGHIVLVAGEAGVGKSRLAGELAVVLQRERWTVRLGNCFERDRGVPYAPVADLLRQLVGSPPAPDLLEQLGDRVVDLARILPELGRWLEPDLAATRLDAEQDRRRLFQVVGDTLAEPASREPVLLIVEDVHWADDASLDLLQGFARTLSVRRAFLLLTYRSDEAFANSNHALGQLRENLARARLARELDLAPLEGPDVDAMLRAILGLDRSPRREFLEMVSAHTEGNPFFVEELVRTLIADGQLIRSGGTWSRAAPSAELRLPRTVLIAVQRQSEALSDAARRILEIAAVVGQRFDFDFVCALLGVDEADFLASIKELIGAGLLIEVSAEQLAFRHALTRQAILSQLLARERRAMHRSVAEAIEETYPAEREAHLADLAEHYYAAGLWAEAFECARRAGEGALHLYAPGVAVEQFNRALESAEHLGLAADPDLLQGRGRAREAQGDFDGARADYTAALAAVANPAKRCEALLDLGALWASRDYAQAGQWFEQALDAARLADDLRLLARSLNRLGNWLVNIGRTAEGLELHRQALALLEPEGDLAGIAETVDLLGMGLGLHGDPFASIEPLGRAVQHFRALGDRQGEISSLATLASLGSPETAETSAAALRGLEETLRDGSEALRLARHSGSPSSEAYVHLALGAGLVGFGELGEALEHGDAARGIAVEIQHEQWQLGALCVLGEAYVAALAAEQAIEVLDEAFALARHLQSAWWTGISASYLGLAYLLTGNPPRARATLRAAWPREHTPSNAAERRVARVWGELALAEREPRVAQEIATGLLESTPGGSRGQGIPWVHRLAGEAQQALGQLDEALVSLELACLGAVARQQRPALWQVQRALARLHLARHAPEAAYANIEAARSCVETVAASFANEELARQFESRALATLPRVPALVARRVRRSSQAGSAHASAKSLSRWRSAARTAKLPRRSSSASERSRHTSPTSSTSWASTRGARSPRGWPSSRVRSPDDTKLRTAPVAIPY
jgi:tetratricopeptide (TPR) repeat protein